MLTSVLIDVREPPEFKKLDYGVPSIVPKEPQAADLIAGCSDGNTLAIERKTADDLLNSIRDGRLFSQCAKMRQILQFCYVVVTGRMQRSPTGNVQVIRNLVWVETGWNWDSVQGALLTCQEMGVGVIFASDFREAVFRLAKRDRNNVTIHPVRASEPMAADEAFLASLPGIGAITAQRILANGPAAWALCWLVDLDNGHKVKGIGRNQKTAIRKVLGLKSNENLWIQVMEANDGKE